MKRDAHLCSTALHSGSYRVWPHCTVISIYWPCMSTNLVILYLNKPTATVQDRPAAAVMPKTTAPWPRPTAVRGQIFSWYCEYGRRSDTTVCSRSMAWSLLQCGGGSSDGQSPTAVRRCLIRYSSTGLLLWVGGRQRTWRESEDCAETWTSTTRLDSAPNTYHVSMKVSATRCSGLVTRLCNEHLPWVWRTVLHPTRTMWVWRTVLHRTPTMWVWMTVLHTAVV